MNARKTILIVDDDPDLRRSIGELLTLHEDIDILEAENGASALEVVKTRHLDAILLDVCLPDLDGRDVCRLLRRRGVKIPILMLTVADSDANTIVGLDAGANDYIIKPFHLGVLLARLGAQLRQHERSDYAVVTIGPYSFCPSTKLLTNTQTGRKERLTEKETAILKCLLHASGKMVPREALLSEVWNYKPGVTTHRLETQVYRLRQKIESDPTNPKILLAERGGYRLVR